MHTNGASAYAHLEARVAQLEGELSLLVRGFDAEYVPLVIALRREVDALRAMIERRSSLAPNDGPTLPQDQRSPGGPL